MLGDLATLNCKLTSVFEARMHLYNLFIVYFEVWR